MAKKKHEEDEVIVDIGGTYNKVEQFIEDNKEKLTYAVLAIVVVIGGVFGYNKMILEPAETEASDQIWKAQQYFNQDSLNLALNGDGINMGFEEINDTYGSTKAGKLATYYMGLIYLKNGQFEDAVEYLGAYSGNDVMVSSISLGAMGDAYMELDKPDDAVAAYVKAARKSPNEFTTPIYLLKAGKVAEALQDYSEAVKYYQEIKDKYAGTNEGRGIDKYLARAQTLASK